MSGAGDIWSDMVKNFFQPFVPDDKENDDENSPRRDSPSKSIMYGSPQVGSRYVPGAGLATGCRSFAQGRLPCTPREQSFDRRPSVYGNTSFQGGGSFVFNPSGRSPSFTGASPRITPRASASFVAPASRPSFAEQRGSSFVANSPSFVASSSPYVGGSFVDLTVKPDPNEKAPFADITIPFKDGSSQMMNRPRQLLQDGSPDPQQYLKGGSFLRSEAYKQRENNFFISDMEDIVDVKLAEYFKARPDAYLKTKLTRIRPGIYSIHEAREIQIEWVESELTDNGGKLIVKDGPLRQPLTDYLNMEEPPCPTARYDGSIFQAKNDIQKIPKECRLTFVDTGLDYSRVDAMKMAKEQAAKREAAAGKQAEAIDRRLQAQQAQLRSFEIQQKTQRLVQEQMRSPSKPVVIRETPTSMPSFQFPGTVTMRSPSKTIQPRDGSRPCTTQIRSPAPNTLRGSPSWERRPMTSPIKPPSVAASSMPASVKLDMRRTVSPISRRKY